MKGKSIQISDLHLKYAEKSWNETFQLVRRCMDKSRDVSKPCEPLVRSLERLQEVLNVSNLNTMKSRLEVIAKQQRMGFHITDVTCYLTADLFYLEVVLLPCGEVKEVKVAPHGAPPVSSETFLQLLRSKDFAEFSVKLEGLYAQYNIPGDNELRSKLFASLQWLGKDLQQISQLPRAPKDFDPDVDETNNGRMGSLITGKEDCPLLIHFFTTRTDGKTETSDLHTERVIYAAQVTVGDSDVPHKLQVASVISQPAQLDPRGNPVSLPSSEGSYETFPAVFLLKLQPAIPMMASFINDISQITDVTIPDVGLQWAPLPKLLMRRSSANTQQETSHEQDAVFKVSPSGDGIHRYVLPGAVWQLPAQGAAVVHTIPFTQPSHVPAVLELLRHQCAINTLLGSCLSSQRHTTDLGCDLHFEVLPESDRSFSVTFQRPNTDSLAVLLLNVSDSRLITCTLFGAGIGEPSVEEYLSTVVTRSVSIPVTLRSLYNKLELTSAPLSPRLPDTTEAENDHCAPSNGAVTDNDSASTTTLSQSASVPEESSSVSGSACYAVSLSNSELHPEINTSPAVDLYTYTPPAGVFPPWVTSNGQLSEPI